MLIVSACEFMAESTADIRSKWYTRVKGCPILLLSDNNLLYYPKLSVTV